MGSEDAARIGVETDAMTGEMMLVPMGAFDASSGIAVTGGPILSFERSRTCPAGGNIAVEGEVERTQTAGGVLESDFEASGTWNDCAWTRNGVTITINGEFTFESHRARLNGEFVGLQTSIKFGHFTWTRSNGTSGACSFEVHSVRNPETRTRTVTGVICGETINRVLAWNPVVG
jgi:hypothetical protein